MFGRLLRVTCSALAIAVAFVTPVLATAAATPASADTVVNGCTIVSNPTPTNFTNCPGADLMGANLSGLNLSYADLAGAALAQSTLNGADLSNANLSLADVIEADLGNANLSSANLSGLSTIFCVASPSGLPLTVCLSADFTNATLTGVDLTNASLAVCATTTNSLGLTSTGCGGAGLSRANLSGANFTGATLGACLNGVCGGANFTGTLLVPSDQTVTATSSAGAVVTWPTPPSLPGATPGSCPPSSGSTFPIGVTTVTCQVLDGQGGVAIGTFTVTVNVVVDGCTIVSNPTPTNFTNCPGANLSGANLSGLNLSFANLAGANLGPSLGTFAGADLSNANLSSANLSDVTTVGCFAASVAVCFVAHFIGANLTNANLNGASLGICQTLTTIFGPETACGGALFGGADLTGANFTGATFTGGTNFAGTLLVPSDQTVVATSSAGAVVSWPTPPSLPGATPVPGSCTGMSGSTFLTSGSTFPIGTTTVSCEVVDDQGSDGTGTFTVTVNLPPPPTTFVGIPSNGANVTGDTWLDAGAQSAVSIASVSFEVSGGSISNQVISGSTLTPYGWIGAWNSSSVPNGTYTIQSVATDVVGQSTTSAPVTITVNNPTDSITMLIPTDGATQTGTSALLDAGSTAGVTSVSYELSGGTLSNQVIATGTATLYGWLAVWNTTSVPIGTYTLESVGTVAGGTVTSAPITITVSN